MQQKRTKLRWPLRLQVLRHVADGAEKKVAEFLLVQCEGQVGVWSDNVRARQIAAALKLGQSTVEKALTDMRRKNVIESRNHSFYGCTHRFLKPVSKKEAAKTALKSVRPKRRHA